MKRFRRLAIMVGVIALPTALAVVPASADHVAPGPPTTTLEVQPTGVHGNPTCSDVTDPDDFLFEFKLEPVEDGTFPLSFDGLTGSVTVDQYNTPDGQAFDFSFAGDFVAATVVVKGGPDANLYDYIAASFAPGAQADTFLHAPINPNNDRFYGLSHISFCVAEAAAELEITKTAVDDTITVGERGAFDITVTSLGPATAQNVTIDDELPNTVLDWEIVSEDIAGACSITGGNTLDCDVGNLAPSNTFTVRVQTTAPIALGSEFCGDTLDNTAFADADNADEVSDDASIDVICGAIEVNKFAKVPGSTDTQPVAGAGFTLFHGDPPAAVDPPGEVTTGADGIACFDGLPVNTEFTLTETTVPSGYAAVGDQLVTSSAENADCEGTGMPTSVSVENLALTDISIDVTAQIPGATESTIVCAEGENEVGNSGEFADPASLDVTDLEPGTYTCTIVIDP
ncbi:MAG TPA: SpaA isopeptide-forming pilin-related protein [Jiangellaceae bacterium]